MKKRFTFKCWNCPKTYTLYREITDQQELFVACPYCNKEGVMKILPSYKVKPLTVMRHENSAEPEPVFELVLPDVLPTQKPE